MLIAAKGLTGPADLPSKCVIQQLSLSCLTHLFLPQGLGGLLIRKIEGDYNNVVGFPAASFFTLLDLLVDEEPDFLDV